MTEDVKESKPKLVKTQEEDFKSLVLIECSPKLPPPAVEWVIDKIKAHRDDGGGELWVKNYEEDSGKAILHIGAPNKRLLVAAEIIELKKEYKDGTMREVTMADLDQFRQAGNLDQFLTSSEKQRLILHELDSIRALEGDEYIPGLPKQKLYRGEAILARCLNEGIIEQCFPLHDRQDLKSLGNIWYQRIFGVQPIDLIQRYFGETVAMYFAFLGFYTMALIPPALIGLFFFLFSVWKSGHLDLIIFFSVFNMVWVTIYLESWKRYCATLAYKWGTISSEPFEEARPQYYGELGFNKITGRLEPKYPKWKRVAKFYFVSLPVVAFCLFIAFLVMLLYFQMEVAAMAYDKEHQSTFSTMMKLVPTIIYALIIVVMNALYRKLAKFLNDWENHRLESAYENHLITKLVLFDFVNCFMSLFYVAFYLQDMILLRSHLAALLITQQVLGQIQESVLPYFMYKRRKSAIIKKYEAKYEAVDESGVRLLKSSGLDKEQAEVESSKDIYPSHVRENMEQSLLAASAMGTIDDYLEMFLQFGYVFLFSAVFPSAAFWALANNITEIRTDAFKLCRIFQRPFARPTAGIGAWQIAFEMMSVMAVMTNCALVAINANLQNFAPDYGEVNLILLFVLAEHVILFIKVMLSYLIPDEPEWVETALRKADYESKQAWRQQRVKDAQKHLDDITHASAYVDADDDDAQEKEKDN